MQYLFTLNIIDEDTFLISSLYDMIMPEILLKSIYLLLKSFMYNSFPKKQFELEKNKTLFLNKSVRLFF